MWVFLRVEWEILKGKSEAFKAQEDEVDVRDD